MPADIHWEREEGAQVAVLRGRIDGGAPAEILRALQAGISPGDDALVMDLHRLQYINSSGLRVLLKTAKEFRRTGRTLRLCGLTGMVSEVISVSGFDRLIPVEEDRTAALRACRSVSSRNAASPSADSATSESEVVLQGAVDFGIVNENIRDIVHYVVAKYEYENDVAIAPHVRERAVAEMKEALRQEVHRVKRMRMAFLRALFASANAALVSVLGKRGI